MSANLIMLLIFWYIYQSPSRHYSTLEGKCILQMSQSSRFDLSSRASTTTPILTGMTRCTLASLDSTDVLAGSRLSEILEIQTPEEHLLFLKFNRQKLTVWESDHYNFLD